MTSVVSLVMSPVTTCIVTFPILTQCIYEVDMTIEKQPPVADTDKEQQLTVNTK